MPTTTNNNNNIEALTGGGRSARGARPGRQPTFKDLLRPLVFEHACRQARSAEKVQTRAIHGAFTDACTGIDSAPAAQCVCGACACVCVRVCVCARTTGGWETGKTGRRPRYKPPDISKHEPMTVAATRDLRTCAAPAEPVASELFAASIHQTGFIWHLAQRPAARRGRV